VAERIADFRKLGFDAVAVAMSRPDAIARYLAERPLPFPLLADPERAAYAAFQLKRTTVLRLLRPDIGWRYMKSVLRGGKIRRVPEGEDPLQTGGDFLVADGKLLWEYTTPDPTDRPTVDRLLQVIRDLAND
jgi:hypothetical protein